MTTIPILTIVLFSLIATPYTLVRAGRWSAAAYRNWVIGAVGLYVVLVGLVLLVRAGKV
jgi:hypothetical protein